MVEISNYYDTCDEYDNDCLSEEAANKYATDIATSAIQEYIKQQGVQMNANGINEVAQEVLTETQTNAAIITGEILLENIETLADTFVLSRLSWWKRLTITKKNKELAITVATYAIIHAIKTGGFGLTKYRINHKALDYVTLAANARIIKSVMKAAGVDTNIARMLLTMPEVSQG